MKKLLLLLLLPVALHAQNYGSVDYLCQAAAGKTLLLYRMPDSTTAIQTTTANTKGFYRFSIHVPGLYLIKYVNTGTDTVSVERFPFMPMVGIGGDSTSNAGRLIQNANDSLPASGGFIFLPPGVHLIDSNTVTLKSNVWVFGTGPSCILKQGPNLNGYVFTIPSGAHDITLSDFAVNGDKGNHSAGGGINANGNPSGIRRVHVKGIRFRHIYDNAIVFANYTYDCDVSYCYFDSIGTAGQTSATTAFGIYAVSHNFGHAYDHNTFTWWSGTAAIRINGDCHKFELSYNKYRGNDKTGSADRRAVFADSSAAGGCDYINISNDHASDIDESGFFFNFVNNSRLEKSSGDSCGNHAFELNGDNLSLIGLQARRSTSTGIIVNNAQGGVIQNCISDLNGDRGIYVFAATGDSTTGIPIIGNTCLNNSQSSANQFAGIEVGAAGTGKCRRFSLIGNTCFDNQGSKTQKYGIQTTNDCDYYTIMGNPVSFNATGGLNDGGTGANKTVTGNP